jgi:hypothetical protein
MALLTHFCGNKPKCNNRRTVESSVCSFSCHVTVLYVTETGGKNMYFTTDVLKKEQSCFRIIKKKLPGITS